MGGLVGPTCMTESVRVDGATLEDTTEPASRASIARQCCIRLASA